MSSSRMPGMGHGLVGRGGVSVLAAIMLLAGFAPVSRADEREPSAPASPAVSSPADEPPASEPAESTSPDVIPSPSPSPVETVPVVAGPGRRGGNAVLDEPPGDPVAGRRETPVPVSVSRAAGVVPAALSAVLTLNGSSAVNRIVDVGTTRPGFGVEVSGGSADSVSWSVDDPAVLSVTAEGSSARVTGVSEGVTRLRVRVRDGSVSAEDWAWITVQTDVPDTPGAVALVGAGLYPSATTDSDRWVLLSSTATATVLAVSDKWVRLQFRDGVVGSSDDTAWASKYVVDIPPTSVSVSPAAVSIQEGQTAALSGSFLQSYANDVSLAWSSSASGVATVSTTGVVRAVAPGTATITLTGSSSHGVRVTATARITVTAAAVPVTGVTLDKTTATLTAGSTLTLTATVTPSNATNKAVTWSSSNTAVATVSPTGTVTGKTGGTATITVTTVDGGKIATAKVTVTVPVIGVTLNKTSARVVAGSTVALVATVVPSNATNKAVTWSSSNDKVATVSSTGLVTTRAGGSATITVTTSDGTKKATAAITVIVPVTGVTVSPASVKVPVGKTTTLRATVHPSTATNQAVTWSSSNTAIATVSPAGVVTGRKAGTAKITAKATDGGVTGSATVTVVIPVTGVTVSPTSTTLAVGGKVTIKATVTPPSATEQRVTWYSSDAKVAQVSSGGVVTGKKAGTVTLTATTTDGGRSATAKITVVVPVTAASVSPTSATLAVGKTITLKETVTPSNATNKKVTWKTSNSTIASVDANGRVTAKKAGQVTITVTTADRAKTAKSSITVVVPVTGVTVTPATRTLECCTASIKAKADVKPPNATNKKITWTSSNPKVAKVSKQGQVTGVNPGKATITATTEDGKKTDTVAITVITTIAYNANGGWGAPETQTKTRAGKFRLSTKTPTRHQHTFKGWATSPSATRPAYGPGDWYKKKASVPLYAVWRKNYVSLGDSFASGEGAGNYRDVTGFAYKCHQSKSAFGQLLAEAPANRVELVTFAACSGATTADILRKRQYSDTRRQLEYVTTETGMATVSIGGNDVDFAGTLMKCLLWYACTDSSKPIHDIQAKIGGNLRSNLRQTYKAILDRDGTKKSVLYVFGYPMLTPQKQADGQYPIMCGRLGEGFNLNRPRSVAELRSISRAFANVVSYLDSVIASAALMDDMMVEYGKRIVFVPLASPGSSFNGHGLCDRDPYFNGLVPSASLLELVTMESVSQSFHPNAKGHKAYLTELRRYYVRSK